MQRSCFSKNAINSLRRTLRLSSTFPASFTPWIWKTDLAVSRPIMLMLMVGGSPVAGFNDPQCGTSMPLGPSTPSVEIQGSRRWLAVIQALDGALCSDGRPVGEDGTALPGEGDGPGTERGQ